MNLNNPKGKSVNKGPEKNGELVVNGQPAAAFIPEFCHDARELCDFEFAAYDAYDNLHGKGACDRDKIEYLSDLFGKEFSDRVHTRRWVLQAKKEIGNLETQRAAIETRIQDLKNFIKNPDSNRCP